MLAINLGAASVGGYRIHDLGLYDVALQLWHAEASFLMLYIAPSSSQETFLKMQNLSHYSEGPWAIFH